MSKTTKNITEKKTVTLDIPDYLTIKQYIELQQLPETDSKLQKSLYILSTLTGISVDELQYWDLESIKQVNEIVENLIEPGNDFYPIIEWKGTLYGYSNIKQHSLGEYIDLEELSKDINNNLHKIVALMYRPITNHKFNTFSFQLKHHLNVVKNKEVANVFDGYTIEEYDNNKRKQTEDSFLDFPVSIALGALSFFLLTGNMYLNNIVFSETQSQSKMKQNEKLLTSLIANIGGGGALSTHSLKPIYYLLPEMQELPI